MFMARFRSGTPSRACFVFSPFLTSTMDDQSSEELGLGQTKSSLDSAGSVYQASELGRFTAPSAISNPDFQSGDTFVDSVAIMLVCRKHNKVAFNLAPEKGHWFPTCALKMGQSYTQCVHKLVRQILLDGNLLDYKPPHLLDHLRLQVPTTLHFVERLLFYSELAVKRQTTTDSCCRNNLPLVSWISLEEAISMGTLWGAEPAVYLANITQTSIQPANLHEVTIKNALSLLNDSCIEREMLRACRISHEDLVRLYGEFAQHCFPSGSMSSYSFFSYLSKSGITLSPYEEVNHQYFRSFQTNQFPFINMHEFVLGFVALDERTSHGGRTGSIRVGFMFRYYKRHGNQDGLSYSDVRWFTRDLILHRNHLKNNSSIEPSNEVLECEVNAVYAATGVKPQSPISVKAFLRAIGSLQIRGTSSMYRVKPSPVDALKSGTVYCNIYHSQAHKFACTRCRKKQFALAAHYVTMSAEGHIYKPQKLPSTNFDLLQIPKAARRKSDQAFHAQFVCNELIEAIRSFVINPHTSPWGIAIGSGKNTVVWVEKLMKLCNEAKKLFCAEDRIVQVASPVYVLGDIHGNLNDLMSFERQLWRTGPICSGINYLFLGDYVDRGEYSMECVVYLFCCKILAPSQFTLLRGNHEVRAIQQAFTFERECLNKFGNKDGSMIWEAFNQVFDTMPLAATIDGQIYCAHGGIPSSITKLQHMQNAIPCPMSDPEMQSPPAWEVLWNDPVTNREFSDVMCQLRAQDALPRQLPIGFVPNDRRGTAYYFADDALNAFLETNRLSHVLRGHELQWNGFGLHFGGRLITVFSTSLYCGLNNACAVLLVAYNKIRITKMDTSQLF